MSEKLHLKVCDLLPYFWVQNIHGKDGKDFPPKSKVFLHHNLNNCFFGIPPFNINFFHPLGLTVPLPLECLETPQPPMESCI